MKYNQLWKFDRFINNEIKYEFTKKLTMPNICSTRDRKFPITNSLHSRVKKSNIFLIMSLVFVLAFVPSNVQGLEQSCPDCGGTPITILDDATGGDCSNFGIWDDSSKTCILTTDLNEEIKVYGNNITLDGNNHVLTGEFYDYTGGSGPAGITVSSSGVTVKNFVINGFLSGILFTGDSNIAFHNIIDSSFSGFQISGQGPLGGHNVVKENSFLNTASWSFQLTNTNGNEVYDNNFINNDKKGSISNSYNNIFNLDSPKGGNYYKDVDAPHYLDCTSTDGTDYCSTSQMVFGTDSQTGDAILDTRPRAVEFTWTLPAPIIHPSSPCNDGCAIEGNNPDLKIFASGYIENTRDGVNTISSVWKDPDGVVVYDAVLQVDSQGQFNNEFDNSMYVRDMRDSGLYTTTYTYDDVVLEYQWNYLTSVYEPEPEDGSFTLPCSMQEAGDGVSASSCHGFYTNSVARAEVGINYHTGLFPIENYEAVGFFLDENGSQMEPISVTLDIINPGESKTLIFENTVPRFVSEFQMQMLGGDLVTEEPDTTPPVVVVPNDMAIEVTSNNPSLVTFSVSASDDTDDTISVSCTHDSGSNFPIGVTTVTCTATDSSGNSNSESFTITLTHTKLDDTPKITKIDSYFDNRWHVLIEGSGFYPNIDGSLQIKDSKDWDNFGMILQEYQQINIDEQGSFSTTIQLGIDNNYVQSGNYDIIVEDIEKHTFSENYIKFNDFNGGLLTFDFSTTEFIVNEKKTLDVSGNIDFISDYGVRNEYLHLYLFKDESGSLKTNHDSNWNLEDIPNENGDFHMAQKISFNQSGHYKPLFYYNTAHIWGPVITVIDESSEPEVDAAKVIVVPGSSVLGCEEINECYIPYSTHVSVGGEVTWHNDDSVAHTVTSGTPSDGPNGIFDSSLFMAGSSFSYKFGEEGTYHYFCMVHPWMQGEVIVGQGGPAPTPSTINIKTTESSYTLGDKIRVTGVVRPFDSQTVSLRIFNPQGDLALVDQFTPSSSGTFTKEYTAAGDKWRIAGTFSISASIGTDSDKVIFRVTKPIPDKLPEPGPFSDTVNVSVSTGSSVPGCEENNSCYIPYEARVNTFGKVTWHNDDSAAHTVTSGTPADGPDGIFDSSLFMAGAEFSHKFEESGIYDYFCMVHPWMQGILVVGQGTARPAPEPEPDDHIDLDIWMEQRVYDINTVAVLNIEISGNTRSQNIAIDVADPRDTTKISRSVGLEPNESISLEFRIDESFKTGNYRVTATTSDGDRTEKDTAHFKVKSQFNAFKITSVEVTNQKGNPDDLVAGETGFIKVELESNKSIATLVTVNIFDSELTSIGIGSVQTTLSSGSSEIILSFMIPEDTALGPAEIFVNAFSDWPSNGGVPLTGEFAAVEDIQ